MPSVTKRHVNLALPKVLKFLAKPAPPLPWRNSTSYVSIAVSSGPGLWARLSRIDGESWIAVSDLCLWDGSASPRGDRVERSSELRQMKNLRFGYPSLAKLPGGDVMAVFWCVEDCVSNIRWIRLSPGLSAGRTA